MLYISNFMLDIFNLNPENMKRSIVLFIVAAITLATTAWWFFSASTRFQLYDLLQFGIIVMVVGLAIFVGYKRLVSAKRGEPAEDELSKHIMRRTAAWSYYISLYLWLVIMYVSDKVKLEIHSLIGAGILGMAVVFTICWLVFNFTGIKNE
jgi:peptidoglycan/LPS O-acetylase OafA/YrhL